MEKEDWGLRAEYKWCIHANRRPNGVRSMLKHCTEKSGGRAATSPSMWCYRFVQLLKPRATAARPQQHRKQWPSFSKHHPFHHLILWVLWFSFLHLSHPFWGVYGSLNMNLEKVLSGFMIIYLSNIEIKTVTVWAHGKWVSSPHPLEGSQVWEGPCDTHLRYCILQWLQKAEL